MTYKDAIEAARVIKEYCVDNIGCQNCPFEDDRGEQTFCWFYGREDEPHKWNLDLILEAQHGQV